MGLFKRNKNKEKNPPVQSRSITPKPEEKNDDKRAFSSVPQNKPVNRPKYVKPHVSNFPKNNEDDPYINLSVNKEEINKKIKEGTGLIPDKSSGNIKVESVENRQIPSYDELKKLNPDFKADTGEKPVYDDEYYGEFIEECKRYADAIAPADDEDSKEIHFYINRLQRGMNTSDPAGVWDRTRIFMENHPDFSDFAGASVMAGARYYIGDEMERFFGKKHPFVPTKDHEKNMIETMMRRLYYISVNGKPVTKNGYPMYFTSIDKVNSFIRKMNVDEVSYAMPTSREINDFDDLKKLLNESDFYVIDVYHLYESSETKEIMKFYSEEAIRNLGL